MDNPGGGSSCENDLMLLDRVFLRLANADTDEQLQNSLSKFLSPVIQKLASPHEQVRTKVMELLVHVNKRVSCRNEVQLPVSAMIQQYKDPQANSFVINFSIIYISMGFPRLPKQEQVELAPDLLHAIHQKPTRHQDKILFLLAPILGDLNVEKLNLKDHKELAKLVLDFCTDLLILPYRSLPCALPPNDSHIPPGMTPNSYKRMTINANMTAEELEQLKVSVVKFLDKDVFCENSVLLPLIVAAADPRFNVANEANAPLSKVVRSVDWSSLNVAIPLFEIYLGSWTPKKPPQEEQRTPGCTRLKLKLLPYIMKLTGPAILFPHSMQVIFTSLFGENANARLRNLVLSFLVNVINNGDKSQLEKVQEYLLRGLLKLIRNDELLEHHPKAFMGIGRLAVRVPGCMDGQFAVIEELMQRVVSAGPEIKTSLRDSLLDMAHAFKMRVNEEPSDGSDNKMEVDESPESKAEATRKQAHAHTMVALINHYLLHEESVVRYIATRYAAVVFTPDYVPSKYLLLLASADSDETIANEALRYLYGTCRKNEINDVMNFVTRKYSDFQIPNVPPFQDMVEYVWNELEARKKGSNAKHRFVVGNHVLPINPAAYQNIICYMRMCLNKAAGLKECTPHPNDSSPLLGKYIRENLLGSTVMDHFLTMVTTIIVCCPEVKPLTAFLDIIGCVPEKFAQNYSNQLPFLKNLLIKSTKEDLREICSTLYAIISVHTSNKASIDNEIKEFVKLAAQKSNFEAQCGYASVFTHLCERSIQMAKQNKNFAGNDYNVYDWEAYKEAVQCLAVFLKSPQSLIASTACSNIALVCKVTALPFPNSIPQQETRINAEKLFQGQQGQEAETVTKFSMVEGLFKVVNNQKFSANLRGRAVYCLGALCCGERFPYAKHIVRGFLDLAKESKDFEMHLDVGEALVLCVDGFNSKLNRDAWLELPRPIEDVKDPVALEENDILLDFTLEKLLAIAKEPHPNSKQATSLWLLALVKNCAHREPIKTRLDVLQNTFMEYLSENNEVVQDIGSKGLSLVYQCAPESVKQEMVNQIIDQMSSGRRAVQKVTSDTKIFEEGALGSSPTGGNLSTYKELCSLASDLNQPDLLYKFMHLANHNSIWNSKKGAAFGFQSLAINAGAQLEEHLPKIIPRLFRYRFDPTPKIHDSMIGIWHALVPETSKTVQKYFKEILEDLATNLTANDWRVRMSCCNALVDLLREVKLAMQHPDLMSKCWRQIFRVLDDVHEPTRLSAQKPAFSLSKITIRASEPEAGKEGTELMAVVLPVLLETGITHLTKAVRNVSLVTVSQMVKTAGETLKPFLSELIPALCAAAGDVESVKLSYLSSRLAGSAQTQKALDELRASAVKDHYTINTCTMCLPYIDMEVVNGMLPKMIELLKTPQLGTKVACCHMIVLICKQLGKEMEPVSGKIMAALLSGTIDRNAAIRQSFCEALGEISAHAKSSSIEKLLKKLVLWHETKDDDNTRMAIAYTLKALSKVNPSLLKGNAEIIAPMVFLAKHTPKNEDNESMVEAYEEAWESLDGINAMKRFGLAEATLKALNEARAWTTKIQAAKAISALSATSGGVSGHRVALLRTVLAALKGKYFDGKQHLLNALASLCKVREDEEQLSPSLVDECIEALVSECGRRDLSYRTFALKALADTIEADNREPSSTVLQLIGELLQMDESSKNDSDDEDKESMTERRENVMLVKQTAYDVITRLWPSDPDVQEKYESKFLEQCRNAVERSGGNLRLAAISATSGVLEKLHALKDVGNIKSERISAIVDISCKIIDISFKSNNQSRYRRETLKIVKVLAQRLTDLKLEGELKKVKDLFANYEEELTKDLSHEVKLALDGVLAIFKKSPGL